MTTLVRNGLMLVLILLAFDRQALAAAPSSPVFEVSCFVTETTGIQKQTRIDFSVPPQDEAMAEPFEIAIPGTTDSYDYHIAVLNQSLRTDGNPDWQLLIQVQYSRPFCNPPVLQPAGSPPVPPVCDRPYDPNAISAEAHALASEHAFVHLEGENPLFNIRCDGNLIL